MSVIYDFRQGWEDGRRERDAERAAGYDNSLFWTDGVVARPREQKGVFDNLFGGDKGGGSSWPEERRALVELCEQQQAEIAEREARLAGFEAALAERDGLAADVEQWRAALEQRDGELEQWRAALTEADAEIRSLAAARDRYQANGRRALAQNKKLSEDNKKLSEDTEELRALYAALVALRRAFPRLSEETVKRLRAAVHPDHAKGGAQQQTAVTKLSQELAAVLDRIARAVRQ